MVTEPLFEYVGMQLSGYTVVNPPDNDDDEDDAVEASDEPELLC